MKKKKRRFYLKVENHIFVFGEEFEGIKVVGCKTIQFHILFEDCRREHKED